MVFLFIRDRDRIRTCDRLLRRQMLYPAELRDLSFLRGKYTNVLSSIKGNNLIIWSLFIFCLRVIDQRPEINLVYHTLIIQLKRYIVYELNSMNTGETL